MLELKNIKKDYVTSSETVNALKDVTVSFRKKEFVSVLGPSGCGKTTMLNIIGGLDHYTEGDLIIDGKSTKFFRDSDWDVYRNHRIGFIFQSYNLIPHQTILENVELALTIAGIGKEEKTEKAKNALERVGLSGLYNKKPNQLSGGQCQRVAIARALVNDPEILLADEPTGALDTVTSVQIMDLIKEISGERLVIMVTHNPKLAQQYSTRIVRLLDGNIVEDTNPMTENEVSEEYREKSEREEAEIQLFNKAEKDEQKKILRDKKKQKEKAKMSLFAAFRLSFRNLISKKGRTALVGIAGSIGIIGIALVLAFSAGIKGYVESMQDDMLSGNPIVISELGYDVDALTKMLNKEQKEEILKDPNYIYINSMIDFLVKTNKNLNSVVTHNKINEDYIKYIESMPKDYYSAILKTYGVSLNQNLYTDFKFSKDEHPVNISISNITDVYMSLLRNTDIKEFAYLIPNLSPNIKQAPNNNDYLLSQYDVLCGDIAKGKNADGRYEIMLVVNKDDELSDLLLARYGYLAEDEFMDAVKTILKNQEQGEKEPYKNRLSYNELMGKVFTYYPNDTVFTKTTNPFNPTGFDYNYSSESFDKSQGVELEVVGILSPKDSIYYGSMASGIYYTEDLTKYILEVNRDSQINQFLADDKKAEKLSFTINNQLLYGIPYKFNYTYEGEQFNNGYGIISYEAESFSNSMIMPQFGKKMTVTDMRDKLVRTLGGNAVSNNILIYPKDFENKDLVTDYLDRWNSDVDLNIDGKIITPDERRDTIYTDSLQLVISMINMIINVVSTALIAFTSISLLVSTVMIGIITYVSVVERIKEIGVIRALGGRKKDVRHLFNAETVIIGLLSGAFGIVATYLISIIVNLILKPVIGYASLAALPISNALILILLSVFLTLISGFIPASSAAKKDPVESLRTE